MNYKAISKISCKIISIYTFAQFIIFFQRFYYQIFYQNKLLSQTTETEQNSVLLSLPFLLLLFTSIILWIYADKISDYMVRKPISSSNTASLDYVELQAIAFSVVGVIMLINSIPEIISIGIHMKQLVSQEDIANMKMLLITYRVQIIGYAIKIVLGLWLLLGARGIVGIIKNSRTVREKEENE